MKDLCTDDGTALVLLCLLYHELGTLSILCGNLFCFNSSCKLTSKGEIGNGHIIQSNVEAGRPLLQNSSNLPTHHL